MKSYDVQSMDRRMRSARNYGRAIGLLRAIWERGVMTKSEAESVGDILIESNLIDAEIFAEKIGEK